MISFASTQKQKKQKALKTVSVVVYTKIKKTDKWFNRNDRDSHFL